MQNFYIQKVRRVRAFSAREPQAKPRRLGELIGEKRHRRRRVNNDHVSISVAVTAEDGRGVLFRPDGRELA